MTKIGFGDNTAFVNVYIENIPPLPQYENLSSCIALKDGEINHIGQQTGNHWRKVFNVYAKFIYELKAPHYDSWQSFRDQQLLQKNSKVSLLFSAPKLTVRSPSISIVMGKTYANKLGVAQQSIWLSETFAIHKELRLIICPYFDYRQLSNIKITQLCQLVRQISQL